MTKKFQELLNEASLSRVKQHFDSDRPVGIITAFRKEYPYEENIQRNRELEAEVRRRGFGFVWVDGAWIEDKGKPSQRHVSEVSLFIIGREGQEGLYDLLLSSAVKYNQDAFVYKEGGQSSEVQVIGKDATVFARLNNTRLDKTAEIYTKLRHGNHVGRSFVLEGVRQQRGFGSALVEHYGKGYDNE